LIYVVDTHALIWHLTDSPRLGKLAKALFMDPDAILIVPAMVLAEVRFLEHRRRVPISWDQVMSFIDRDPACLLRPLDRDVAERMPQSLNIHDAVICATALVAENALGDSASVITRDRQIRDSGVVQTVW
jgi:PIN domain nuclease of toxin-antitoxin system